MRNKVPTIVGLLASICIVAAACVSAKVPPAAAAKPTVVALIDTVTGFGVVNLVGGGLFLAGALAFVGSFIPVVGVIFPRSAALPCAVAGLACLALFSFVSANAWVVNAVVVTGVVAAVLTYWPSIRVAVQSLWFGARSSITKAVELVTREDINNDGKLG